MKKIILLSGVMGTMLLVLRLVGTVTNFEHNKQLLIVGVLLLATVYLPLTIVDNYLQRNKIRGIIKKHKEGNSEKETTEATNKKSGVINYIPFRSRKSGLTWGGGNIKGANASRGTKRQFLK